MENKTNSNWSLRQCLTAAAFVILQLSAITYAQSVDNAERSTESNDPSAAQQHLFARADEYGSSQDGNQQYQPNFFQNNGMYRGQTPPQAYGGFLPQNNMFMAYSPNNMQAPYGPYGMRTPYAPINAQATHPINKDGATSTGDAAVQQKAQNMPNAPFTRMQYNGPNTYATNPHGQIPMINQQQQHQQQQFAGPMSVPGAGFNGPQQQFFYPPRAPFPTNW